MVREDASRPENKKKPCGIEIPPKINWGGAWKLYGIAKTRQLARRPVSSVKKKKHSRRKSIFGKKKHLRKEEQERGDAGK